MLVTRLGTEGACSFDRLVIDWIRLCIRQVEFAVRVVWAANFSTGSRCFVFLDNMFVFYLLLHPCFGLFIVCLGWLNSQRVLVGRLVVSFSEAFVLVRSLKTRRFSPLWSALHFFGGIWLFHDGGSVRMSACYHLDSLRAVFPQLMALCWGKNAIRVVCLQRFVVAWSLCLFTVSGNK